MPTSEELYEIQARALFDRSLAVKARVRDEHLASVAAIAGLAVECLAKGNKLLLAGNGGSAADAQHIAAEFLVRLRTEVNRRALPAIALSLDVSTLTASANDYGYERIYARALEGLGREGDVFLGFTTSGRSPNILRAFEAASAIGIKTAGFLGGDGGAALALCDQALVVPSTEAGRVQEVHITAGHAIVEIVEDALKARRLLGL